MIGNAGSVALTGSILLLNEKRLTALAACLTSLAGGTLLGAAFLGMLPKACNAASAGLTYRLTLAGILLFFITEKFILWHYCSGKECKRHQDASAQLILIGDGFHNFIDGIAIAAAYIASIPLGITVTLSVFAHEIPQELADFGILIRNGYTRKKAFFYNLLSGSTALAGGITGWIAMESAQNIIPWVLSFSAASFIYIALADLVPRMHQKTSIKDSFIQISLIVSGIAIIYLIVL